MHIVLPALAGWIDPYIATEAVLIPFAADLLDIHLATEKKRPERGGRLPSRKS
jgi:hypothetical protein